MARASSPSKTGRIRRYMECLLGKATDCTNGHLDEVSTFYRNKSKQYFEQIKKQRDIMTPLRKDNEGDPTCLINGRLDGIFFSVSLYKSGLPTISPFGDTRIHIPIKALFNESSNLYFADFFCLEGKIHYIIIVLTKSGTDADDFCREKLPLLDRNSNNFLRKQANGEPKFYTTSKQNVFVEVFYTENVNIQSLRSIYGSGKVFIKKTRLLGYGHKNFKGTEKNRFCQICNLPSKCSKELTYTHDRRVVRYHQQQLEEKDLGRLKCQQAEGEYWQQQQQKQQESEYLDHMIDQQSEDLYYLKRQHQQYEEDHVDQLVNQPTDDDDLEQQQQHGDNWLDQDDDQQTDDDDYFEQQRQQQHGDNWLVDVFDQDSDDDHYLEHQNQGYNNEWLDKENAQQANNGHCRKQKKQQYRELFLDQLDDHQIYEYEDDCLDTDYDQQAEDEYWKQLSQQYAYEYHFAKQIDHQHQDTEQQHHYEDDDVDQLDDELTDDDDYWDDWSDQVYVQKQQRQQYEDDSFHSSDDEFLVRMQERYQFSEYDDY